MRRIALTIALLCICTVAGADDKQVYWDEEATIVYCAELPICYRIHIPDDISLENFIWLFKKWESVFWFYEKEALEAEERGFEVEWTTKED